MGTCGIPWTYGRYNCLLVLPGIAVGIDDDYGDYDIDEMMIILIILMTILTVITEMVIMTLMMILMMLRRY